MSGIHVRKIGGIDWIQQREEPILTVPGSYWLCCKNNIYKFIFRYHRANRITQEEFTFGKELMKIIRKIIKCKPRQGQQFGTRHLLVTYNHTSWTRQDKMFAMLKFKERTNAGTFSHAFVLTIKVSSVMESVKSNVEHSMTTRYSAQSLILQGKDSNNKFGCKTETSHINGFFESSTTKEYLQNDIQRKYEKGKQVINLVDDNNHLNNISTDSNWRKGIINDKPIGLVGNNTNAGYSGSKLNLPSEQSVRTKHTLVELEESKSFGEHVVQTNKRDSKDTGNNQDCSSLHSKMYDVGRNTFVPRKLKRLKSPKAKSTVEQEWSVTEIDTAHKELSNAMDESFEVDTFGTFDDLKSNCNHNHNTTADNSTFDEAALDSANLPYQYLIEKEIENAKNKQVHSQISTKKMKSNNNSNDEQNHKKRKLSEANGKDEKHTINSTEVSKTTKTQDSHTPKRRKNVLDRKASRSSNITDLVMEGLMFTIRQGQDSVAVIEQKAKLEMDEVLENSEKVETKNGEKSLRNASLLRLENLVTMIDLPKQTESNKNCNTTTNSDNSFNGLQFTPFINKPLFSTTRENFNNFDGQKERDEVKEKLQWPSSCYDNVLASTSFASDDKNHDARNRGKYSKVDGDVESREFAEDKMYRGEEEEEEQEEEQEEDIIPEALQDEICKNSKFKSKSKSKSEELQSELFGTKTGTHDLVCETGTISALKDDDRGNQGANVPRVVSSKAITMDQMPLRLQQVLRRKLIQQSHKQLISQTTMYDTLENALCVKESNVSTCTDKLKHTENILTVISKTEACNDNVSQDKSTLQESETNVKETSTDKRQLSPENKYQDITQDFYHELSQIEKRNNSTDRGILRQRRESLNTFNDVKDNQSRVEMLKLIQDITRGAKVVVRRMSTKSIHSIIGKSSSLATCMN